MKRLPICVLLAAILAQVAVTLVAVTPVAVAQSRTGILEPSPDPRGKPELIVCSQNLDNFGSFGDTASRLPGITLEEYQAKTKALAKRILRARCDVVAVPSMFWSVLKPAQRVPSF